MTASVKITEANRQYYDLLQAGQEAYWKHMAAPRARVKRIVALASESPPSNICDFGCGNGALLKALGATFPDAALHGIDLSQQQIAQNKKTMNRIKWSSGDINSIGFKYPFEGLADLAISSEVIEHVENPGAYLVNVSSGIMPGGRLILSTQSGRIYGTEEYVGHVRHWKAAEITEALENAGFVGITAWNEGLPFHDLSKWVANINTEKTIRSFGVSEYGAYQKLVCLALRFLFMFNSGRHGAQLYATAVRKK